MVTLNDIYSTVISVINHTFTFCKTYIYSLNYMICNDNTGWRCWLYFKSKTSGGERS